jgi:hypothetical protein
LKNLQCPLALEGWSRAAWPARRWRFEHSDNTTINRAEEVGEGRGCGSDGRRWIVRLLVAWEGGGVEDIRMLLKLLLNFNVPSTSFRLMLFFSKLCHNHNCFLSFPLLHTTAGRGESGMDNPWLQSAPNPNFKDMKKYFKYLCRY